MIWIGRCALPAVLLAGPASGQNTPAAIDEILANLRSARFATRRDAVRACRGRKEPELIAALERAARADGHPNIRAWAIEVLGDLREDRLLPLYRDVYGREPSVFPRGAALVAMAKLGKPELRPLFEDALAQGGRLADAAARALAELGDPSAFDNVAAALDRAVATTNGLVYPALPEALLRLDEKRAVDHILGLWDSGYAAHSLGTLARALGERMPERQRAFFTKELAHERVTRAYLAIDVLGRVGDPRTAKRLHIVYEQHPKRRYACANALAAIGYRGSAVFLASWLSDVGDANARAATAHAIGRLGDARAVPRLCEVLRAEDEGRVKIRLIEALGRLGDGRAAATLVPFLDDEQFTAQDLKTSQILPFPWNTRVCDVAAWAITALKDRKEPLPVETLCTFPGPKGSAWAQQARERLARWWKELPSRTEWRFQK